MENELQVFYEEYDFNSKIHTWKENSNTFTEIWKNKFIIGKANKQDFDELVFIIDSNARGSTKADEAVARTYIRYPIWYKMFSDLNEKKELRNSIHELFELEINKEKIIKINEIYKLNEINKNGLTTKNAIILNALLFLSNPNKYISSLSINHRNIICSKLSIDYDHSSNGGIIIDSNTKIIDKFKKILTKIDLINKIDGFILPRFISDFIYSKHGRKIFWENKQDIDDFTDSATNGYMNQSFYLEKYLESFIYTNWENIEKLGKNYEFITDSENEPISLQYHTNIGNIDLLVKHKKNKEYLVVELKKSQTSDQTIGQVTRYMGWVFDNLAKKDKVDVKGLIIAEAFDDKIKYSLKFVNKVDLMTYKINFDLKYENKPS